MATLRISTTPPPRYRLASGSDPRRATLGWIFGSVILLFATGCRSFPDLAGRPESHGLLIFEIDFEKRYLFGIKSTIGARQGTAATVSDYDDPIEGHEFKDLLVFVVKPETYVPRRVHVDKSLLNNWEDWSYYFPFEDLPVDAHAEVEAGRVTYCGILRLKDGAGISGLGHEIVYLPSREAERRALRKLRGVRDIGPWNAVIEARLEELDRN